jgi:hypothetical protein
MWKVTEVVVANPVIVLGVAFAGITCFKSNPNTEFGDICTAGKTVTPSIAIVADAVDVAAFATTIFVTTVVVDVLGTVYSVVLLVAAAVRASALVVVAINYYLSFRLHP